MYMKDIHKKIFELAKPHYKNGRPYDIPQVERMIKQVSALVKIENLDEDLLMPLCILHDIGYSTLKENNPHPKSKEAKIAHMAIGAEMAQEILEKVKYEENISKKIVHYVSVHDNWILGDDAPYTECKEMAIFNDLDFTYAVSDRFVLDKQAEAMNKSMSEMYEFWINDEKIKRRPFYCTYTRNLFYGYMEDLKKIINKQ